MLCIKLRKYVIGLREKNYHDQKRGPLLQDCDKIYYTINRFIAELQKRSSLIYSP